LELEVFSRFGQVLDPRTERVLDHGRRIRAILQQVQSEPHVLAVEVALLLAVHEGILDLLSLEQVSLFRAGLGGEFQATLGDIADRIEQTGRLESADRSRLLEWIRARIPVPSTDGK
jgi:F0F1-type ATP synthase alpha subunit